MDLTTEVAAGRSLSGGQQVELAAGTHLKIETAPDGEELLDQVVPEGKVWAVTVTVLIRENDAE